MSTIKINIQPCDPDVITNAANVIWPDRTLPWYSSESYSLTTVLNMYNNVCQYPVELLAVNNDGGGDLPPWIQFVKADDGTYTLEAKKCDHGPYIAAGDDTDSECDKHPYEIDYVIKVVYKIMLDG